MCAQLKTDHFSGSKNIKNRDKETIFDFKKNPRAVKIDNAEIFQ